MITSTKTVKYTFLLCNFLCFSLYASNHDSFLKTCKQETAKHLCQIDENILGNSPRLDENQLIERIIPSFSSRGSSEEGQPFNKYPAQTFLFYHKKGHVLFRIHCYMNQKIINSAAQQTLKGIEIFQIDSSGTRLDNGPFKSYDYTKNTDSDKCVSTCCCLDDGINASLVDAAAPAAADNEPCGLHDENRKKIEYIKQTDSCCSIQ